MPRRRSPAREGLQLGSRSGSGGKGLPFDPLNPVHADRRASEAPGRWRRLAQLVMLLTTRMFTVRRTQILLQRACVAISAMLLASACTTVLLRQPVPERDLQTAAPYGIRAPLLWAWGDSLGEEEIEAVIRNREKRLREAHGDDIAAGRPVQETILALSGGGPDGAFGAGYLNGWTARGDRPQFTLVTGVSTGAIIALFAFLGPDYDDELTEIYTQYSTDDFTTRTIFTALTGGTAVYDTREYRALIEHYIGEAEVNRLAEEYRKGRTLLVGTTNLDAGRPVIWNVSAIAATGHPAARTLIQDIIQASSAVPAAFPPVLIPVVTPDGRQYDEMHVDGGATQQLMLFSPSLPITDIDRDLGLKVNRTLYVIVNNKLKKAYDPVRPRVLSIAGKSLSTLIGGSGTGDLYKLFAMANRDGTDLEIVSIPQEFGMEANELWDPVYMKTLYDIGYQFGFDGNRWEDQPPDFDPGR